MGCSNSKTEAVVAPSPPKTTVSEPVADKHCAPVAPTPSVQSEETRPETPVKVADPVLVEKAAETVAPIETEVVEYPVVKSPVSAPVVAEQAVVEAPVVAEQAVVEAPVVAEQAVVEAPVVAEQAVVAPVVVETPVVEPHFSLSLSVEAKAAYDVALDAQTHLLAFQKDPAFTSQGKSGAVELSLRPGTDSERQVVVGKMNYGTVFTADEVKDFIMDITIKGTWDGMFQDGKVIADYFSKDNRSLSVSWAAYKKQMGVAGRDFVYVTLFEKFEDGKIVISTRSMNLPAHPEGGFLASHCRGTILDAGYVIEPINGETVVTFMNQCDLGGSIPNWIVNRVQMKQPANLADMFNAMKKHYRK